MDRLKSLAVWLLLTAMTFPVAAQSVVSLDSCRNMALRNNKTIRMAEERVNAAKYTKKAALGAYFPGIDFSGTYMYNQKNMSLTGANMNIPDGLTQIAGALVPQLPPEMQQALMKLKNDFDDFKFMEFDMHHVFAGVITVTQPVYMGGKIKALNDIASYAHKLSETQRNTAENDVVFTTDEAYWQVVSLVHKERLAESYVALLDTLNTHVISMIAEGVATQSDGLTVAVKLNEAQIMLTKVQNGLTLSRMLLAQICGLPVDTVFQLEDEEIEQETLPATNRIFDMDEVYAHRQEVQSLIYATKIYQKKKNLVLSDMLPKLALIGTYSFSNPNSFNGFKREFDGMFSAGVVLNVPILHWGTNYNKVRAAKSEAIVAQLQLEDVKEKIELQVNQAVFKSMEAQRTLDMTVSNMAKAEENLQNARLGFQEGVLTATNVLEAQTAWLQANSEKIDAQIDLRLCEVYLAKATGTMSYDELRDDKKTKK